MQRAIRQDVLADDSRKQEGSVSHVGLLLEGSGDILVLIYLKVPFAIKDKDVFPLGLWSWVFF